MLLYLCPQAEKPAAAPAPAPEVPAAGGDEEEEAPKPKAKGPFDDLPPSPMNLDHWKRTYSNSRTDYYKSMESFWNEQFDKVRSYTCLCYGVMSPVACVALHPFVPSCCFVVAQSGYSIWFARYKHNDENTVDWLTSNLVGGFLQRCEVCDAPPAFDRAHRVFYGPIVCCVFACPFGTLSLTSPMALGVAVRPLPF